MKTTYEQFIEANNKLVKCFDSYGGDRWKKLSVGEQDGVCRAEKDAVKSFLVNNKVGFANLLKERLEIVNS